MLIGLVFALLVVVPAARADLYNPADWAPAVWSDKADYAPGERVTLNGTHWTPGETVHIRVNDDTGSSWDRDVDVTADETGGIVDEFDLPDWFVAQYRVTATGASGAVATHTFTDSNYYVKNASTTPAGVAVSYKIETFSSNDCSGTGTLKFSGTLTGPNAASGQAIGQDTGSVRFTYVDATGGYGFDVWKRDNHAPGSGGANDGDPVPNGGGAFSSACDSAKNGGTVTYAGFSKLTMQNQTISFAALADRTYGDADVPLNATASSGLPVSYAASGACSLDADKVRINAAGSCTVTASQAGGDGYKAAPSVDRTFAITKAPLSVKANDASREYGEPNPDFTGEITGVKNGDAVSATYSAAATPSSNVGSYPIVPEVVATAAVLANYQTPVLTNGTLQVTKAPLLVKADDNSREYGAANPEFTGEVTGLKNGDEVTASFSTSADEKSGVGPYKIVARADATDAVLANYEVELIDGTLTVTKAPLSVNANDATRLLGADNPAFTGQVTGIKNGDAITASYSTTATKASPVGVYDIVPSLVDTEPGVLANYEVTLTNGKLTIVYRFDGFMQPINDTAHQTGVLESRFKAGSTVPVKFQVKDAAGLAQSQLASVPRFEFAEHGTCDTSTEQEPAADATSSDSFRWDSSLNGYTYNFSTKSLKAGEYRVYANLGSTGVNWLAGTTTTRPFVDICLR
jgi:hypothetical protein